MHADMPRSTAIAPATHPAFNMTAMLLGFLPMVGLLLLVVGKLRRHRQLARLWALARRLCGGAFGGRHRDKFADAVDERMNQWRDIAACVTCGVVLYVCIVETPCELFLEESVCTTPGISPKRVRELLVGAHVLSTWECAAFLFAQGGCRGKNRRLRQAHMLFIAAVSALDEWLSGAQALLLESWVYKHFLFMGTFGSCASPALALPCVALQALATIATYRVYIPDGMVVIKQMSNDVGPCEIGCLSFIEPAIANEALGTLTRHGDALSRFSDEEVDLLAGLADGALRRKTHFAAFAQQELIMVAVLSILLVLFHLFLRQEAVRSFKLQSSTEQLAALSRMLANYTDATFQLSEDGRIAEDAPKLDLMLHLGPTPHGLRGKDFASFIASLEERSRFQEAIRPGGTGGVLAGDALYLDLRTALYGTACGNVRAQVLGAEFMDGSGERRLLFGLVELQTDGQAALHDTIAPIPPAGNRRAMKYKLRIKDDEDERSERAYQNHQGTPVAAASIHSGSLSDKGSDSDSDSESAGSAPRAVYSSGAGSIDTSTDNLMAEVELAEAGAWICRATKEFKFMSGLRQTRSKAELALAELFQHPEQAVSSLQALSSGDGEAQRSEVLRFCLAKRPLELACRAHPTRPVAEGSGASAPKVRLQVLSLRRTQPATGPSGGAEPEADGQSRAGRTMQL